MQLREGQDQESRRNAKGWKHRWPGGVWGFIGYMLSPLSWWNDLFVNVPLAAAFAWMISLIYQPAFRISLVVGYWLTNVLGLYLLHQGARRMLSAESPAFSRRELVKDIAVSLVYTLVILLLVKYEVLEPMPHYLAPAHP